MAAAGVGEILHQFVVVLGSGLQVRTVAGQLEHSEGTAEAEIKRRADGLITQRSGNSDAIESELSFRQPRTGKAVGERDHGVVIKGLKRRVVTDVRTEAERRGKILLALQSIGKEHGGAGTEVVIHAAEKVVGILRDAATDVAGHGVVDG